MRRFLDGIKRTSACVNCTTTVTPRDSCNFRLRPPRVDRCPKSCRPQGKRERPEGSSSSLVSDDTLQTLIQNHCCASMTHPAAAWRSRSEALPARTLSQNSLPLPTVRSWSYCRVARARLERPARAGRRATRNARRSPYEMPERRPDPREQPKQSVAHWSRDHAVENSCRRHWCQSHRRWSW